MKCLVVVTHPLKDSLCSYLAEHIVTKLVEQGHDVTVENLYESGFDPALSSDERSAYYDEPYDSSGVAEQVCRLQNAEAIVLVYPTWWFGFPAMLKGWFDRVWSPGIAYEHANDLGPIQPRLNNLRHVLAVTTLGSPWWVDRLVMWQPVKRVLKVGLLGACSRGVRLSYLSLYQSENVEEARVARFALRIDRAVSSWQ